MWISAHRNQFQTNKTRATQQIIKTTQKLVQNLIKSLSLIPFCIYFFMDTRYTWNPLSFALIPYLLSLISVNFPLFSSLGQTALDTLSQTLWTAFQAFFSFRLALPLVFILFVEFLFINIHLFFDSTFQLFLLDFDSIIKLSEIGIDDLIILIIVERNF